MDSDLRPLRRAPTAAEGDRFRRTDGIASLQGEDRELSAAAIGRLPTPLTSSTKVLVPGLADTAKATRVAQLIAALRGSIAEPSSLIKAVSEMRTALSIEGNPPIQQVIDLGGLPLLVARLRDPSPLVQLEAAWALTNAASGTTAQTMALVEAGAVEGVFEVLASRCVSERPDLCDHCLWLLGNVAGDEDVVLRDRLLNMGVVGVLGQLFQQMPGFSWDLRGREQVLRTLTWLMSSLCRGRPAPPLEEVDCAFDYFVQVLSGTDDAQMLCEALWGLCYLLEGAEGGEEAGARARRLLSAGFSQDEVPCPSTPHPVLVQVVRCMGRAGDRRSPLPVPALRLLGALVNSAAEGVVDLVLSAGALTAFRNALLDGHAPVQVRRDAAWALSNIAAGTPGQARRLIDEANAWDAICEVLERGSSHNVRRECAWALTNVAKRGSSALSRADARKVLRLATLALHGESDPALQRALLDAVEAAFQHGDEQAAAKGFGVNPLVGLAEEFGLLDQLEDLQHSQHESICRKARQVIEAWFGADRENMPPQEGADRENLPPEGKEGADRENLPPEGKAHAASGICGGSPMRPAVLNAAALCGGSPMRPFPLNASAICAGSPIRPSAYQFGA